MKLSDYEMQRLKDSVHNHNLILHLPVGNEVVRPFIDA